MQRGSSKHKLSGSAGREKFDSRPSTWLAAAVFLLIVHLPAICEPAAAQAAPAVPDAPQPQTTKEGAQQPAGTSKATTESPCKAKSDDKDTEATSKSGAAKDGSSNSQEEVGTAPCPPHVPIINWYTRFLNGPEVKPFTPKEKGLQAVRNFVDPFNAITIAGNSAIYIGIDSHTAYGPGMAGWGKNVGISYAQDGIGEFFGTFLIPSIAHQDPHYHRMPNASVPRRFAHAVSQIVWTQGDHGRGMLNYANLVGFAIDGQLSNFYVPGVQTNAGATASRYLIGLSTAPIDNIITEFIPDIARRIHVRVVLVQRIIDQVSRTESNQ